METTAIRIPDPGQTEAQIAGDTILFVSVAYDVGTPNPLEEMDGVGEIIALRRGTPSEAMDRAENARREDPDAVGLSYYEHGGHVWFVRGRQGNRILPDFQWDGVSLAGVWIPDSHTREAADGMNLKPGTAERRAWMIEQAEGDCDLFTAWGNGNVYRYSVTAYEVRLDDQGEPYDRESDYRRQAVLYDDGCGGFFDQAYMAEEIRAGISMFLAD